MSKPKIVAIVGSLKKWSLNRQLAMLTKQALGNRADFEILEYADVPFMNEDIEFPAPEAVTRVREKVKEADAVWFFTPEHNHYFSSALKNVIDWLSRPAGANKNEFVLAGKPAAISGISVGMSGTCLAQEHLYSLINFLGMKPMNTPRMTVPFARKEMNEGGTLSLTLSMRFLNEQVEAFLAYLDNN